MAFRIFAFAFPLGLDTLALAIALGLRGFRPWKPALIFTMFEGVMPLFGIGLARLVGMRFQTTAVVAGGLLLIGLGVYTIREATRGEEGIEDVSFSSLRSTVMAGLAISTDELTIGFPLGVSGLPIGAVLATIVVQTFFATVVGVTAGSRLRASFAAGASRYAGIAAGVAFALVGLWSIVERTGLLPHLL